MIMAFLDRIYLLSFKRNIGKNYIQKVDFIRFSVLNYSLKLLKIKEDLMVDQFSLLYNFLVKKKILVIHLKILIFSYILIIIQTLQKNY